MKPAIHLGASVLLSLFFPNRAKLLCILSGVLPDIDHIFDYLKFYGCHHTPYGRMLFYTDIKAAYSDVPKSKIAKIYVIFHSWEAAALLWFIWMITRNIYVLAMASGYCLHLFLDLSNPTKTCCGSTIYRLFNDFDVERLKEVRVKKEKYMLANGLCSMRFTCKNVRTDKCKPKPKLLSPFVECEHYEC